MVKRIQRMKMKRDMKRYFEITNGRYLRSLLILAMMMVGEAVGLWGQILG